MASLVTSKMIVSAGAGVCAGAASVRPVQWCAGSSGSVLGGLGGAMVPGQCQPSSWSPASSHHTALHWHGLILTQLANEQRALDTEH